ncbi:aminotransferase class III-fold pyridoxal phosphate-dependent enzyme, partial [Micromonospora sp. NPDC047753]|uniref:aminotransferase class III-fold pyridoxal phosphate-dependent enzyme n=1 Tax=Micromonospora sp. NPDC047753 TaxID=3154817 RepID=UPI0033F26468
MPPFPSALSETPLFAKQWTLTDADNAWLTLTDPSGAERRILDCVSTYGAVNFGHRNPEINPFGAARADLAPYFQPAEGELFAQWLRDRLDLPEHRALYQIGGSFAVSTAIALAQHRRPGTVVVVRGGYHGLGVDTVAMSESRPGVLQHTDFVSDLEARILTIRPGEVPTDWRGISAFLYEPVQGANGYVPLDVDWLRECATSAAQAGVTVIADEIQAGFYRHGSLSPSMALSLHPDILLFGKSMTNGLFPLSVIFYDRRFEETFPGRHALMHTFQTSALGMYAAWAVARYLDRVPQTEPVARIAAQLDVAAGRLADRPGASPVFRVGPVLSFAMPDKYAVE